MKIQLLCFAILMAFASCSSNNDEILTEKEQVENKINAVNKISWNFPVLTPSSPGYDPNYTFEYDVQGRVVRKNGGVFSTDASTGFGSVFTNTIYTTISYSGNTAVMGTYSLDPLFIPSLDERKFEFDNQGKIIKSFFPDSSHYFDRQLTYNYNSLGRLVEILTEYPNMPYDPTEPNDYVLTFIEKFSYDTSGNLTRAVTTERNNNADIWVVKEIEFSDFDTAQNPLKGLDVFEDYFYLSLSKNNPKKKVIKKYVAGNLVSDQYQIWTSQYNSNGTLKLYF